MIKENAFLLFFLLLIQIGFSQEKYHFDRQLAMHVSNKSEEGDGELTEMYSSTDSTYYLSIQVNRKTAFLTDSKKNLSYLFKTVSKINTSKDYKKLRYPLKFNYFNDEAKKEIDITVEEAVYENDTIKNSKIVEVTTFKNSLKKVIEKQTFYFFILDKNLNFYKSLKTKEKFKEKFNIDFKSDENLKKIIISKNNTIISETEFLQLFEDVFDLEFKVNDVKYNNAILIDTK